jgi:hypothetical protein
MKKITIELTLESKGANTLDKFRLANVDDAAIMLIASITHAIQNTNIPNDVNINGITINGGDQYGRTLLQEDILNKLR